MDKLKQLHQTLSVWLQVCTKEYLAANDPELEDALLDVIVQITDLLPAITKLMKKLENEK